MGDTQTRSKEKIYDDAISIGANVKQTALAPKEHQAEDVSTRSTQQTFYDCVDMQQEKTVAKTTPTSTSAPPSTPTPTPATPTATTTSPPTPTTTLTTTTTHATGPQDVSSPEEVTTSVPQGPGHQAESGPSTCGPTDLSSSSCANPIDTECVIRRKAGRSSEDKRANSTNRIYSLAKPMDWNTAEPQRGDQATQPTALADTEEVYFDVPPSNLDQPLKVTGELPALAAGKGENVPVYEFVRYGRSGPLTVKSEGKTGGELLDGFGKKESLDHTKLSTPPSSVDNSTKPKSRSEKLKKRGSSRHDVKAAKRKSRALKRENPFSGETGLMNLKDGALPELFTGEEDEIYDAAHPFLSSDEDGSGSSDFDSCISDLSDDEEDQFNKALPPKPGKQKNKKRVPVDEAVKKEEDTFVLPVELKTPRPVPRLPECPAEPTPSQIKIRGVLTSLTESEASYINSLERLDKEYREPILSLFSLKKPEVKKTFDKVAEILNIHKICQIELGEKLRHWNTKEEIGNIFNIFSGKMVIGPYSEYVNNFEAATEIFKDAERTKPNFRDFLQKKQMSSPDRLSLPGLMLKPVQRFPQFIMIIKDLLKHTPRDHHDREVLQEALTGIENVAHQLNERKRLSEQCFHGNQILKKLKIDPGDKSCFLLRQDDVEQLSHDVTGVQSTKHRRLFLMNESLISVSVTTREQDGVLTERYTLKWWQHLKDLEIKDSAITPNMATKLETNLGSTSIVSPKMDLTDADPHNVMSDLNDLMHDYSLLGQISGMVASLRLSYKGLSEENVRELMVCAQKEIAIKDYQLQMLSSTSIILSDNVRKKKYIFQTSNADVKQEWYVDFLLAKFALEKSNCPSWFRPESDEVTMEMPAYFMKHLSVDMARSNAKVKCAIPVYFPMGSDGVGVEHLWVCSSTESRGQVSLVTLHTSKPNLVESFQASDSEIISAEMVPGFSLVQDECAFDEDTVWISTVTSEILVFSLGEHVKKSSHRQPIHTFKTNGIVFSLTYLDDQVFGGLRSGSIVVYSRCDNGIWRYTKSITLGVGVVMSLVPVLDSLWVGCKDTIYIVDVDRLEVEDTIHHSQSSTEGSEQEHISCLVKAGVGVWVACSGKPTISLYHVEKKKLLQEFNIGLVINEFLADCTGKKETRKDYEVTSMVASLGLLWVGTNIGLTLTYPLPRLRAGVPRIKSKPKVANHGHSGPVKFIIPVQFGREGGNAIRRQTSSVQRKESMRKSLIHDDREAGQPKTEQDTVTPKDGKLYEDLKVRMKDSNIKSSTAGYTPIQLPSVLEASAEYAEVRHPSSPLQDQQTAGTDCGKESVRGSIHVGDLTLGDNTHSSSHGDGSHGNTSANNGSGSERGRMDQDKKLTSSVESHTYFILEPLKNPPITNVSQQAREGQSIDSGQTNLQLVKSPISSATGHNKGMPSTVVNQKSSSPGKKGQGLSFRSELKKKMTERKSKDFDIVDRPVTDTEVANLYGTLMRTNATCKQSIYSSRNSGTDFRRSRMETTIKVQRPLSTPIFNLNAPPNHYTIPNMPLNRPHKLSFADQEQSERQTKTKVGTSFSSGSSVDTLRKQNTNTMLVVCGGDGYKDWKLRQGSPYRQEEACLLFWLYKY